ncbi:MAG: hypothetical protein PHF74_08145 [Dehalococcoidales bacterium]|nr:hypothetical protein [Dehalococcoidales bacterium]
MRKLLLVFAVLCLWCYGQEVITPSELPKGGTSPAIIDMKAEELTRLQAEKTVIESKLSTISEAPVKYANDRIAELAAWLPKLPDRNPTKAGNITMKQYLSQLKAEVEKNPAGYVTKEQERLLTNKARIEARITALSEEVTNETSITEK